MVDTFGRPSEQEVEAALDSVVRLSESDSRTRGRRNEKGGRIPLREEVNILDLDKGSVIAGRTSDLSANGIGVFHREILSPGKMVFKIRTTNAYQFYVVLVRWSKDVNENLCRSGAKIIATLSSDEGRSLFTAPDKKKRAKELGLLK